MQKLLKRFLDYVKQDTRSDENSLSCPSTVTQLSFAKKLAEELKCIGLAEVTLDANGYVMASLPANIKSRRPVIGFIAHMDTSPESPSEGVNPLVHYDYNGSDIVLNRSTDARISPRHFRDLAQYKGKTIITSDGTTLLGADDKAGIAEIVTAMEYLIDHPSLRHGKIRIAFTPDEEIGRGADRFDVEAFGADFAFTIDGGPIGELEYENFNAASATIRIRGRNVHPGTAKGLMINSISLSRQIERMLPARERPEYTEGYEGFFHLHDIKGNVEETTMKYIIRDHDALKFAARKKMVEDVVNSIRSKYRAAEVTLTMKDQYLNMKEIIEANYYMIEMAIAAYRKAGIEPTIKPVRGGTDGARLSFMGLPCPNIFTGGHNYHGRFEYIPLESMEKAVEVIINLATTAKIPLK